MNCSKCRTYLAAYKDGILNPAAKQRVDEHLASCSSCAREFTLLKAVETSLDDTERVRAPEGLADRILALTAEKTHENVIDFSKPAVNCRTFAENAAALVDGTISGSLRPGMEEHRAACMSCNRLARMHGAVLAAFESAEPVHAPAGLAERILSAAAARERETVASNVPVRRGFLAAALVSVSAATAQILGTFVDVNAITTAWSAIWNMAAGKAGYMSVGLTGTIETTKTDYLSVLAHIASNLSATVALPYMDVNVPVYYIAAILTVAASSVWYFQDSMDYAETHIF